jgi:spermidine synthase
MKPAKSAVLAVLALGFNSIVMQIILMRELLVIFYGNEISVGIVLGVWLLMGGLGSWLFGRFSDTIAKKVAVYILGQLLVNVLVLCSLFLIRNIKPFFTILPGEIMPLSTMVLAIVVAVAPLCLLLGFLFTLGCRIVDLHGKKGAEQVGYVYALEAVGAAIGGILCSLVLIKIFSSFSIILFLIMGNLIVSLWLLNVAGLSRPLGRCVRLIIVGVFIACCIFKGTHIWDRWDASLKKRSWRGFHLIENRNSIYGRISVTRQDSFYSFFNNGLLMFTIPDVLTQEENTHFAMLQRPDARNVLLIGGGSSGILWELFKYPVASVDYVELDPTVIELAQRHLHSSEYFVLDDPRVRIINRDGRLFVQETPKRYDLILLNLPDPFTAQLNRFYTHEFFDMVNAKLTPNGVFAFGVTSSENYVGKELELFLGSIYATLKTVFTDIKIVPGDTLYFLASPKAGLLTLDHTQLVRRLHERGVATEFVREYYLFSKLSEGRRAYIERRLSEASPVRINRDFSPISYYYDMVLWATYFGHVNEHIKWVLQRVTKKTLYGTAIAVYLCIVAMGLLGRKEARRKRSVLVAMATTGFSEISFEIIVIISFQILYGYLYYKLGVMVTSFMVGLGVGAVLLSRRLRAIAKPYHTFIKIQLAICLYPLLLPLAFFALHQTTSAPLKALGSHLVFPLLPIVAGIIGGLQFPLANHIYLEDKESVGRIAGLNYGADMLGSCCGALLVSVFIIPLMGITVACLLVALLNIATLVVLLVNKPR